MKELPHTRSCFVCGEANPLGLKLRFHTDGARVHGRFTPGPAHIGFHGVVHGGLIGTVLDEVMVWAAGVRTKRFAYCAEMTVRYLSLARPGTMLEVMGELVEDRRGRVFHTRGELREVEAGTLLATAIGKYLPVPEDQIKHMVDDFVGGPPEF
jgi:acyl-coenzyme A thioesterase PaaI-like protein